MPKYSFVAVRDDIVRISHHVIHEPIPLDPVVTNAQITT